MSTTIKVSLVTAQGLTLFHFAFLVLSFGRRDTLQPNKEPLPGDVIDLTFDFVHLHPDL
jgi:hypothetical protein